MRLIIFYFVRLYDEIDECCHEKDTVDKCISVVVPKSLLQSEFKDYVYKNYYDKLFDLEKQCCGSKTLYQIGINRIEYLGELI